MSSEARLYTFSQETKDKLRKFRLGTSRAKDPQAVICTHTPLWVPSLPPLFPLLHPRTSANPEKDQIDKKTLEIQQTDDDVYTDMQSLADELPDHSPRFVLLSYPLTLASGRLSVPYVMIYYMPVTCNAELRMVYAGAKELMRNTAEVGRIIEMKEAEELEEIDELLKA
ncbi:hypothetical protein H2201_000391 [Coniosporium apollinis]|uniref:ADF-H domain-containing protein n=1 Tax=Coniosporium apollinis TaxID=61459 RepID=A0ABQ9P4K1_9PEZI|nr:hypothetical protein H2201_000391 [Coniosporium apollinis]